MQLTAETASGAEVPFELIETTGGPRGRVPLYCYRPLTGTFISDRLGLLSGMPTYLPALRAVGGLDGVEAYLRQRGETRIPDDRRQCADAALRAFLLAVFADRTEFGFDEVRFETAYEELERALYEGRALTTVVAALLGIAFDPETTEIALGEGLSLMSGDALEDAPPEVVWGEHEEPNVLLVLTVAQDRAAPAAPPDCRNPAARLPARPRSAAAGPAAHSRRARPSARRRRRFGSRPPGRRQIRRARTA